MTETHQAFPLAWPGNWKRTPPADRQVAKFQRTIVDGLRSATGRKPTIALSITAAAERLEYQLDKIGAQQVTLSTNIELTLTGRPRGSAADPWDVGAAVYFKFNGADRVLACDKWTRVADNIAALAAHIDALRRVERYGTGDLNQAFRGYTAIQPATCEWWLVLNVPREASIRQIEDAFTRLAKQHHPDRGGDPAQMARVTEARSLALQERKTA